jgi:tetratricopeptide (TPR) repeat protein
MILQWFNARDAADAGAALADEFASPARSSSAAKDTPVSVRSDKAMERILWLADHEFQSLRLNAYKRARLANSFKWRLIENGVARQVADEVTQSLVMHLSLKRVGVLLEADPVPGPNGRVATATADDLLTLANRHFSKGEYAAALTCYQDLAAIDSHSPDALNNIGSVLCKLDRFIEAERYFRQAIEIRPNYPEAYCNLGNLLRWRGFFADSAVALRHAIKLKPNFLDAHSGLGLTLTLQGSLHDARGRFKKVLKTRPHDADALFGMGQIAAMEGQLDEADAMFGKVLERDPYMPSAWAAQAGVRKMSASDGAWLKGAEAVIARGISPLDDAAVRFAIGKYFDDVGDFERAFQSYKRANETLKSIAEPYRRRVRSQLANDLIRLYTRKTLAGLGQEASASATPVFVVGMMRSGTSLVEQILSSHPRVKGAGELEFWSDVMRTHQPDTLPGPLDGPTREKLAEDFLSILSRDSADALRVIDKAPVNSDYLGVIHSVFPRARIIYVRRNPIDACLSCYFQPFALSLNFTLDLSDLSHYYKEHRRLIEHWHAVLPAGTILEVPYEELVADQQAWTRRMLDFLGLEWDPRCLDFHQTRRQVVTASYWQVRQKIYKNSVERWRNYKKFIGPLLSLRDS